MTLSCNVPKWQPTRERLSSDCGRPAVAWVPLVGQQATLTRIVCDEHVARYESPRPLDSLPDD